MAVRLAIDIGGTFTDIALDTGSEIAALKVLTTHGAPEEGVVAGVLDILGAHGLAPGAVDLILHGTTLATNAIIEKKGAKTALIATDGFRDVLAIGYEDRYDQYDLSLVKPEPLVPRELRFTVPERVAVDGEVLKPLDEAAVAAVAEEIRAAGAEAIAVSLIHAYARPEHEARIGAILSDMLPDVPVSLSSSVSPEAREFERTMTTVVNAYVQPLMAGYLGRLQSRLSADGFVAPVLLMTSGGGLTTLEAGRRFPVRLVESGPAGGAILAAEVARACGESAVMGFDMGGTTAKICLIDDGVPTTARAFEVDRAARFTKGSGLPLRIPVIDMIEIGAGGGSIARLDRLGRITVGPESAGSEPGPAAYGRGGTEPTVTDADVALGRLDPDNFAGGRIALDAAASERALTPLGEGLGLTPSMTAYGVSDIVDENMANAARVHAVENGVDAAGRTLVAFGGAAPLHAGRLAQKLGISRVIVPANAGVGSAIGFLYAPIAFEVVRGMHMLIKDFDIDAVAALYAEMDALARPIVSAGAPGSPITATKVAYLRYVGQGHEVPVFLPEPLTGEAMHQAFETAYRALFNRVIPDAAVEVLSWSLLLSAPPSALPATAGGGDAAPAAEVTTREVFEPAAERFMSAKVLSRAGLSQPVVGPALIVEDATTTVVPDGFEAAVGPGGHLILSQREAMMEAAQ